MKYHVWAPALGQQRETCDPVETVSGRGKGHQQIALDEAWRLLREEGVRSVQIHVAIVGSDTVEVFDCAAQTTIGLVRRLPQHGHGSSGGAT
jgi:hypothetical protein